MQEEVKYDLFISYRRAGGVDYARMIYLELKGRGYNTFFDYNSLRSGKFNEGIFKAIDECRYFILVLSEGALDRCMNEDDWVRHEIEYALSKGKEIIPICPSGNKRHFPDVMPESFEPLRNIQISQFAMDDLFEKSFDKIVEDRFGEDIKKGAQSRDEKNEGEEVLMRLVRGFVNGECPGITDAEICKRINETADGLGISMPRRIVLVERVEREGTPMTRKLDDLFGKVCENTGHVKWSNKLIAAAGTNESQKAKSGSHKALGVCLVLAVLGGAITVALSMKSSGDKVANEISRVQCLAEQNKSEDCELAELIESNAEYRQKIDRVAAEVNESNYAKARQLEESAGLRKLSGKESIDLLKKVNGAYAGVLDELIERKIKTVDRAIGEFSGAQGGLARMKALTEICKIDNANPRITKALSECEEAVSPVMCLSAEIEGRPISDAVFVKDGTLMRPPYRFVFRNYDGWVRFDAITAVYKGFGKTYSAKLCRFKPNWVGVTNVVLRLREDPAAGTVVKVPVDASNAVEMVWCPPGGDVLTYVDPDTNEKKETVRGVEAGFWIARYELDDDLFSALSSQVSMRGLRNEGVARKSNMSSGEKMPVSRKFLAFHEAFWRGDLYREGMLFGVPTVGQWIRAARFGGFAPKADDFGKYAWYMENSGESVAFPVGSKSASPLGLFDMYGNVPEWTLGSARKWIGLENSEKGGDEDLLTRMGGGCQDDYEGCMSLDRKAVSCRESSAGEKGRAGLRLSGVSMFMYEESFVEWCGVIGELASANAETRKAAIERLAGIAKNGGEPQLRGKAAAKYLELGGRSEDIGLQESVALRRMKVAKCDDIAKLSDWACNDEDEEIRRLAFKRIKSPSPQVAAKYLVRVRESEEALLVFAKSFEFGGQKPTADVLALMATNALNANVRSKAVAKVVDQTVLKDVALKDENLHCVYEAIERMTKRSYLMEIKQESKRKNVRDAARERLESLSE